MRGAPKGALPGRGTHSSRIGHRAVMPILLAIPTGCDPVRAVLQLDECDRGRGSLLTALGELERQGFDILDHSHSAGSAMAPHCFEQVDPRNECIRHGRSFLAGTRTTLRRRALTASAGSAFPHHCLVKVQPPGQSWTALVVRSPWHEPPGVQWSTRK